MVLEWLVRACGVVMLGIAAAHVWVPRHLRWGEEAARLSAVNRGVFLGHAAMIVTALVGAGVASVLGAGAVRGESRVGALASAAVALFWGVRAVVQFVVYDPAIWRGHAGRTVVHQMVVALCVGMGAVYGWAAGVMW